MKKAVIYTNQFFGQIGGEDQAYVEPMIKQGAVGSANLYKDKLDDMEVAATVVCGDNYYAENMEKASQTILGFLKSVQPDILIAGPAFNAGRFGMACGDICAKTGAALGIPSLTGLNEENPATDIYKDKIYIIKAGKSATDMRKSVEKMVRLANKLLKGEKIGLPDEEEYFPKGIRVNIFKDKTGAERALDMLVSKLGGKPYATEIPIPVYDSVTPAEPVSDIRKARICLITSGGIVPKGNPDRMPAATAKFYRSYDISKLASMKDGDFETVHAGYDPVYANADPNRVVPLDVLREMESKGEIGSVYGRLLATTGNSTSVADATRMGQEIARELREAQIDAVILTST